MNHDRMKEQVGKVAYETFEVLMDRLEKEWFILVRALACGGAYKGLTGF